MPHPRFDPGTFRPKGQRLTSGPRRHCSSEGRFLPYDLACSYEALLMDFSFVQIQSSPLVLVA